MNINQHKISPKNGGTKQAMKLTVDKLELMDKWSNKGYALQEARSLQARGFCGSWTLVVRQHTGTGQGETQTIWTQEEPRGTGGNTLESGKTIRHLTQEEGQGAWNEREVSDFKIKQEMTRQDMNQNVNRDSVKGALGCLNANCQSVNQNRFISAFCFLYDSSSDCHESQHHINLNYDFKQWQGSPCCCLPVQEHKGIVVEQPSILSSFRTPMATSTVEPTPPDRLGGLGTSGAVSPSEERSPDAVSSASEATETGQSSDISSQLIVYQNPCWFN